MSQQVTLAGEDKNGSRKAIMRDSVSSGLEVISTDHTVIHDGKGFNITGNFTNVANGTVNNIVFKTPTAASGKYVHMKYYEFWTSGTKYNSSLFENPTTDPTGGTDMNVVNRNRNSAVETAMQAVKYSATIDTTGAIPLDSIVFGGSAPLRPIELEFVLKPDTWYIRTFTNNSGSAADINIFIFWYEA
jgi:hypothetical protein